MLWRKTTNVKFEKADKIKTRHDTNFKRKKNMSKRQLLRHEQRFVLEKCMLSRGLTSEDRSDV